MLERLSELRRLGMLDDLDVRFARMMVRLEGHDRPGLALAACLASHAVAGGSVCVDLREFAGRAPWPAVPGGPEAPDLDSWTSSLREASVVGSLGEFRPLVLDTAGRLYLYRYREYERRLAADLERRAASEPPGPDPERLRQALNRFFPPDNRAVDGAVDWQRIAAAVTALRGLCIVTGGPGTGKTTTVVRTLAALLASSGDRTPAIGLAAPTGKAAARMQESVRAARAAVDPELGILDALPERASTLHRLLGVRPGSASYRHGPDHPLSLDVLVVDEASMIDLALMTRTVEALRPDARLMIVGDRDQLYSVEAGSVLADLCAGDAGFGEPFARRLRRVTGLPVPSGSGTGTPMRDSIVRLRRGWRFGEDTGIGNLASAIRDGDGEGAIRVLRDDTFSDAVRRDLEPGGAGASALIATIASGYAPFAKRVASSAPPAEVLEALGRFRVLTPHRRGPRGVARLNALAETALGAGGAVRGRPAWYAGRPVMIVENDYSLGLFNGDVGVALPGEGGRLRVFFEAPEGGLRELAPARLPAHETVYATTIHRSQGAEYDRVLVVLPSGESPIVTRELLYTAVTRARHGVEIRGPEGAVIAAVDRRVRRMSGLAG